MTGFVLFVIIIVALAMALGPVRDRYSRPGADPRGDADHRRLLDDLRAAASRQASLWERQLDPRVAPDRYATVRKVLPRRPDADADVDDRSTASTSDDQDRDLPHAA